MDVIELLVLDVKKVSVGKIKQMEHHVWHYLKHLQNVIHILQKNMVDIGDLIIYINQIIYF